MKKILIPTDFSIASLNVVHSTIAHFHDEPLDIVLFHSVFVSDSINDLLFMTKKINSTYITQDYTYACEILKKKYASRIKDIKTVFFYGCSVAVFNNFIEGNGVDCIVYNDQYKYRETYRHSINPIPLIKKSACKVITLAVEQRETEKITEKETLSDLLLSAQMS